jgi:hypothetical protein
LVIPTKLPSYMKKFDGNIGEDPSMHIMTYHLWCSSNYLMDDGVRLHSFQTSLTVVSPNDILNYLVLPLLVITNW